MKGTRWLQWFLTGLAALAAVPFLLLAVLRSLPRPAPESPLAAAAAAGDTARLDGLLGRGLRAVDDRGALPAIAWAARAGRVESLDRLLAAGADPNLRDSGPNGWTPLMHAVHKGQDAAVARLLAAGADPDAWSRNRSTALLLAAGQGETAIVRRLLAAGARPRLATPLGATALTNAVAGGHRDVVRLLLAADPGLRLGRRIPDRLARLLARLRGDGEILALVDPARRAEGRS